MEEMSPKELNRWHKELVPSHLVDLPILLTWESYCNGEILQCEAKCHSTAEFM